MFLARRPVARAGFLAAVLAATVVGNGTAAAQQAPPDPRTSCAAIAHIGDSLSVGMESSSYIRDAGARIEGRYEAIGATDVRLDISGGRSVVEHLDGQRGGEDAARQLRRQGFEGCWVIALGTNDAANVDAGSGYGASERIDRMMAIIGDDPVLWVDVKTLKESGHYASENMRRFNTALSKAHARYPALRVFDWSDVAIDDWFAGDGIHYTAAGYAYFAALIADAVADAFPATED
ncbi:MAG: GDSL-type esterase/lipase family protein [Ilumatobacteraceae bacterium]